MTILNVNMEKWKPAACKILHAIRENPEYILSLIRALVAAFVFVFWIKLSLMSLELLIQTQEITVEQLLALGIILFCGFCVTYCFRWVADTLYGSWTL